MDSLTAKKGGILLPLSWILLVALVLNLGVALALGVNRPMQSDSFYFLSIARSLAQGHGYVLQDGFWPTAPTMSRAPGWPWVVSLALRAFPHANSDAVMRVLACSLNAVVAGLVTRLAWVLFRRRVTAFCSGLAYAVYPVALYEAYQGTSEILFVALALAGTLLVLRRDWRWLAGFLTLGAAVLVRPNFLAWIGFAGVMWVGQRLHGTHPRPQIHPGLRPPLQGAEQEAAMPNGVPLQKGVRGGFRFSFAAAVAAILLFLLPSLLWAARNYRVCGHFPVVSTLRGQTLYGGNNSVVANTLDSWGYWVFPNSIPGEPTMYNLSRTMSEYDVDVYYFGKGLAWIREHAFGMPRLVLGKLVRAYVPVPWNPSAKSALAAACRGGLYLLGAAGLLIVWWRLSISIRVILAAMIGANVLTVVVFWGCERFAFELEPFMIPFAVAVCLAWASRFSRSTPPSADALVAERRPWRTFPLPH